MDNKKLLGKRIKSIRKSQGLTQEKLSEMIDLETSSLSGIESGRFYPSLHVLEKIAKVLEVELIDFFKFSSINIPENLDEEIQKIIEKQDKNNKELRAKNLIDRKGGFIGLGRADVLSNNTDFASLTKIDTRNTQEIPLTGKKIKIVTSHPTSSYSLEGDETRPTSIRITNPDLFWKASKCLIIMVD